MNIRVKNTYINLLRVHDRQPQNELCLGDHEIERLADVRPGDTITCTHGVLWVTQAGDPLDYLLLEGEIFVASHPGLVLLQAFDDASCRYYGKDHNNKKSGDIN